MTDNNALRNQRQQLFTPYLEQLQKSFEGSLQDNYAQSDVQIVECPNLQSPPWHLATTGISGSRNVLVDVGGVDNIHYPENNGVTFDLERVARTVGLAEGYIMGPGAGNCKRTKVNSELIANSNLSSCMCKSKYSIVTDSGDYLMGDYCHNDIGVLANLMITDGGHGKVLKVRAAQRKGELNFVSCIRRGLMKDFPGKSIGMGTVFQISKGKIKAHVMPDFLGKDILSKEDSDRWLKFYIMTAPLTCIGILLTEDTANLGLRMEHTHFYSDHNDCGHYHHDVTPEEVVYEGYFVLCHEVYRVEPPLRSQNRTIFFKD